jgi:hypothetical protein
VPGGLGRGRKTGTFPLRLRDKAAGYGRFTGITGRGRVWRDKTGGKTRPLIRHRASGSALDVNRMYPFTT